MKFKIKITQDTIDKSIGCQSSTTSCLFACALRDLLPDARVYEDFIIPNNELWKNYKNGTHNPYTVVKEKLGFQTTIEMSRAIAQWDSKIVESGDFLNKEYELDIPDWVIEQVVNLDDVKQIIENSKTLELI